MKLSSAILFSALSFSAFAECNREAQFIGTATNVKVLAGSFSFQIKLISPSSANTMCPMYEEEVESAVIEMLGTPGIPEGSPVSGVLVYDESSQSYKID